MSDWVIADHSFDCQIAGMDMFSACVMSSIKGNAEMLRQLLDDGEDVDSRDGAGRTPLRLAAAIDTDP